MDPDPDSGGGHSLPHPRQLSRLDDHDPSNPPVSYSTANHAAIAANTTNAQVLAHHAAFTLEPDDFYKSYRALSPSSDPAESRPMASASPVPQPSLRPNGDGSAASHPQLPTPSRNLGRQSLRSVSSPLHGRPAVASSRSSQAGQPSVKDLKKRFDQNGSASPVTRLPLRQDLPPARLRPDPNSSRTTPPQRSSTAPTTARSATSSISSRETQAASSLGRTQRPRYAYAAQDPPSSSSQSFASRVGKPRNSANANSIASKSMTNLPHKSPQQPSQFHSSSPNLNSPSPGLLFGEIPPAQQRDTPAAGFGIETIRPRRTSDSSVHGFVARQRSFSDLDAEPSSPTSWYRAANTVQAAASKTHGRSRSDVSASKSVAPITRKPLPEISTAPSTSVQTVTASRLPVSVRKLNPSTNTSPSSTRSNSPSTLKRQQANGRTLKTNTPTPRAKTPTQTGRKPPSQSLVTPISNPRLQAYIAAGPSKLSPPLRSSRPRQPVSLASTASSRMKETAKVKSPTQLNAKDPLSPQTNDTTRYNRKISVGPIDFERRREHIRLAYSKSIRDSQVFEARRKAAEKKRREMEAAATALASVVATPVATATSGPTTPVENETANKDPGGTSATAQAQSESAQAPVTESIAEPVIMSLGDAVSDTAKSLSPPHHHTSIDRSLEQIVSPSVDDKDLSTPGVAGDFPSPTPAVDVVERPQSVVSAISATTEFDVEPQTEPPVPARSLSSIPISFAQSSSSPTSVTIHSQVEYQYPFGDKTLSREQAPTNPQTVRNASDSVATQGYEKEPVITGAYYDEPDMVSTMHRTYETTVTILPQSQDELATSADTEATISSPRLGIHDESDCHSEFEGVQAIVRSIRLDLDDNSTDTCTEDTDTHGGMEEQRSTFRYSDHVSSHRASTCESSDAEPFDDLLYPYLSNDPQAAADPSNRLFAPPSGSHTDRLSHQSGWTDFSIESTDHSESPNSPTMPIDQPLVFDRAGLAGKHDVSLTYDGLDDSTRSSALSRQHLPELDTGEGFSIPYLSAEPRKGLSYMPSPSHEPPPIPASGPDSAMNSRPSSVFYSQSQYGSTLVNSERESDEFNSQLETPKSLDMVSSETADSDTKSFVQESEELSDKERHRLIQRRNVIKELVDTEAVFVRDMNIVEEIYKGTAEACPNLDSRTIKLVFRNSEDIIEFHTSFLVQLREAVADVYVPKGGRTHMSKEESFYSEPTQVSSGDLSDTKDRATYIGPTFQSNIEKMKLAHEGFLRNSDQAAKRLIEIQQDPTVKMWLNECNEVAKDLTAAWDLDSLLIKPMQRITKYPNLIMTLLQHTPQDHPDREALLAARGALEDAIIEINKTKKNFELVGQIVGRKRKESDVRAGLARAFGKRVDKLQGGNRPPEDPEYAKLEERFSDDYLRLQVVLRDVEFYTRQVSTYVHEFLQYMSAIELIMRLQPGNYPELESKWVQFNISVRDLEKVALDHHLAQVRKHVIEPFEHVIQAYGNPSLAMKKRQKRRVVYERSEQLKRAGKSVDPKLKELVEQYEALNDTLIKELPKLSALTEKVGKICLGNFINIQANWYATWKEKMKAVLGDAPEMPDVDEIVATFRRDFPYANDLLASVSIINPKYAGRASQSTTRSGDDASLRARSRPSEAETRGRGLSVNGESAPVLPAPDFGKRHSGSFTVSPGGSGAVSGAGVGAGPGAGAGAVLNAGTTPTPYQYNYRDYYAHLNYQPSVASPRSPEMAMASRSLVGTAHTSTRPSTGRSFDSTALPRQSTESASQHRRDSNATHNSSHQPQEGRRYSNLFHSALPLPDGPEESQRSSRASSRERGGQGAEGYNILWLAASLFEFNIATTKHEAGYPYLTYQAGEIFDVIAEKGELWLAKNQDDPTEQVGWIWSKHFAKLADS